jgi:hypothetical protein
LIDRVATLIQYVLAADAAVYSWIFTQRSTTLRLGIWIPFALSFSGMLMVFAITSRVGSIRRYLLTLERYFLHQSFSPSPDGWEYVRKNDAGPPFREHLHILCSNIRHHRLAGVWEFIVSAFLLVVTAITFALPFLLRNLIGSCIPD